MERDNRGRRRPEGAAKYQPPKAQGEQKESRKGQPLPNVWDVLERRVRIQERYANLRESPGRLKSNVIKKLHRDDLEVRRLEHDLDEKGMPHHKLIRDLFYHTLPLLSPSREKFQEFRAWAETLSTVEIAEELSKRLKAIREKTPQGPVFYSGGGLFDIYKRRDKNPS